MCAISSFFEIVEKWYAFICLSFGFDGIICFPDCSLLVLAGGGMLVVAMIALAGRNRQAGVTNYVALDGKHCQVKVEEQTVSEEHKAA